MSQIIKRPAAAFTAILLGFFIAPLLLNIQIDRVKAKDEDKPPIVKITTPQTNSVYAWNTLVNYHIVVTDHGKSTEYQEIPSNRVLLQVRYVPDISHVAVNSIQAEKPGPEGVREIVNSNCLGCHGFKSAAMGPSFSAISKRYPDTESTVRMLSKHIRDGSVGVWGQSSMPSHPELTGTQLHAISRWIMDDAGDPNVTYYVGTEGTFRMESAGKADPKAGVVLTASYNSSDANGDPQHSLRGEDSMIVGGK